MPCGLGFHQLDSEAAVAAEVAPSAGLRQKTGVLQGQGEPNHRAALLQLGAAACTTADHLVAERNPAADRT